MPECIQVLGRTLVAESKEMSEPQVAQRIGILADDTERAAGSAPSSVSGKGLSSSRLWDIFSGQIALCGVTLFDLDLPTSLRGTVRVFITKPVTAVTSTESDSNEAESSVDTRRLGGVTLEDCARVSKHLLNFMESPTGQDLGLSSGSINPLTGQAECLWDLEVSSPGINRVLKRPEHYTEAIGNRITIRFVSSGLRFEPIAMPADSVHGEADAEQVIKSQPARRKASAKRKNAPPTPEEIEKEIGKVRSKRIMSGELLTFDGATLRLRDDKRWFTVEVPYADVKHARIDFLFGKD
jgi:ribosome maturation factor RimP